MRVRRACAVLVTALVPRPCWRWRHLRRARAVAAGPRRAAAVRLDPHRRWRGRGERARGLGQLVPAQRPPDRQGLLHLRGDGAGGAHGGLQRPPGRPPEPRTSCTTSRPTRRTRPRRASGRSPTGRWPARARSSASWPGGSGPTRSPPAGHRRRRPRPVLRPREPDQATRSGTWWSATPASRSCSATRCACAAP
jgi:hypothetical protein